MSLTEAPGASRGTFRATLSGLGRPGPIEERIGRRLVRLVDPESVEGRGLLLSGGVELIGPEGTSLGRIRLEEACAALRKRLEERLLESGDDEGLVGLERLPAWPARVGRS